MSLHPQFARPRTLDQAAELLSGLASGAVVIAGGQELTPSINYGHLMPSVYVDIGAIRELKGIVTDDGEIAIGALTVHRDLQSDEIVQSDLPLLAHAATQVGGGWQVHNRGTIGGNIVCMHPLYDILPSLLALKADVEIATAGGVRRAALAEIMTETSHGLGSEAILTRVLVTPMPTGTGWGYEKLKITAGAYGSANAAAVVSLTGPKISNLRVVIGAVTALPVDVSDGLAEFVGRDWSASLGQALAERCSGLIAMPLSDHQGHGDWRRAMAGVVAARAVAAAVGRVGRT